MKKRNKIIILGIIFLNLISVNAITTDDFFTKLIYNTDYCIDNCYAIYEFCNPTQSNIYLSDISHSFSHGTATFTGTELEKNEIEVYRCITGSHIEQRNEEKIDNKTGEKTIITTEKTISDYGDCTKKVKKYRSITNDFVKPKECRNIKISGSIGIGNQVDWVPKIDIDSKKYLQGKWAWWSSDWKTKYNLKLNNSDCIDFLHEWVMIPINGTECENNFNSTRIVYNDIQTMPFYAYNTSLLFFIANASTLSAGTINTDYDLYCNVSGQIDEGNTSMILFAELGDTCSDWGTSGSISMTSENTGHIGQTECRFSSLSDTSGYAYITFPEITDKLYASWYWNHRTSGQTQPFLSNSVGGATNSYWHQINSVNLYGWEDSGFHSIGITAPIGIYNTHKLFYNMTGAGDGMGIWRINNSIAANPISTWGIISSAHVFHWGKSTIHTNNSIDNLIISTENGTQHIDYIEVVLGLAESANTAPQILDSNITPIIAYTETQILGKIHCIDADAGDTITGFCQIYNGSGPFGEIWSQVVENNTLTNICNITSANTTRNSIFYFQMFCGDTHENSSKLNSSSITILNHVPELDIISCNPDILGYNDMIEIEPWGAGDSESDTLYYYCSDSITPHWLDTNCSEGNTGYSSPYGEMNCSFFVQNISGDYTIYCRVYDGYNYSVVRSDSYTITETTTTTIEPLKGALSDINVILFQVIDLAVILVILSLLTSLLFMVIRIFQ